MQKEEALVDGGDLRSKGNEWLRCAFVASGLPRVPREVQIRLAVGLVVRRKKLCAWLTLSALKWSNTLRPIPRVWGPLHSLLKIRSKDGR